jgi:hypothetical protein
MEPVGELRNEIAEHMAGTWEAVQQQQRRRVLRPGLAKKDILITHFPQSRNAW